MGQHMQPAAGAPRLCCNVPSARSDVAGWCFDGVQSVVASSLGSAGACSCRRMHDLAMGVSGTAPFNNTLAGNLQCP